MRSWSRTAAAASCLLLAACGMRVDGTTRQALLDQSVRGGGTNQVGSDPQAVAPVGPGAVAATTGPTTGPVAQSGGDTTTGGAVAGPSSAPLPAGGNGGATDVGVTATSIQVGSVADLSGPQPGLFQSLIAGVRAYFAMVNSQGGVYGRQLSTKVADSQVDCNATTNAYSSLLPGVFAIAGAMSLFDNCATPVLDKYPSIPDVSFAFDAALSRRPATFQIQPFVPGARTGPYLAFGQRFPEIKSAVAALYPDVAGARTAWGYDKAALDSIGYKVVYSAAVSPTQIDWTQYVIALRQAGAKFVLLLNTSQNNAKFINAARQQGYNPPVIAAHGTFYDTSFPQAVGTAPTNLYMDTGFSLFLDERTIKGVALFQDWMRKTAPNQALDQFGVYGWAQAGMFVEALRAAGPKVTRASVIAALRNIHSFTADGLVISGDPGAVKPQKCYLLAHYVNGAWQRWNTPADRPLCGDYLYVKG